MLITKSTKLCKNHKVNMFIRICDVNFTVKIKKRKTNTTTFTSVMDEFRFVKKLSIIRYSLLWDGSEQMTLGTRSMCSRWLWCHWNKEVKDTGCWPLWLLPPPVFVEWILTGLPPHSYGHGGPGIAFAACLHLWKIRIKTSVRYLEENIL
jgi:hypothetical protein